MNRIIYRFRSDTDKNYHAFLKNYLWFSDISIVNDPFDGRSDFIWDKENDDNILISEMIKLLGNEIDHEKMITQYKKINYEDIIPFQISCFSTNCKNILLWSYYANAHKGFCLIFNCLSIKHGLYLKINPEDISYVNKKNRFVYFDDCIPILKVHYARKKPEPILSSEITFEKGQGKIIDNILTKYYKWSDEKEYRAVLFKNSIVDGNKVSYPTQSLNGIILGCEMDKPYEDELKKIARIKGCKVYKAFREYGKFLLKVKSL
jgi:hypothetical protein